MNTLLNLPFGFILNIGLFSVVPLYLASLPAYYRTTAFYCYIGIVLALGGLLGTVYSFTLPGDLVISGGNIAYGAFMMSTVMLIITEHHIATFRNMIRLVILINLFVFLLFNLVSEALSSGAVLNPLGIPPTVFETSLWVLVLGGVLILAELLMLLTMFIQLRRLTTNTLTLSVTYTLAFAFIVCLDGVLFPLAAFGMSPELVSIIVGNVSGKFVLALGYSVPMMAFYLLFRHRLSEFVGTPLSVADLVLAPRSRLLDELYNYQARDRELVADNEKLTKLSQIDGMTGLANRRHFDVTLAQEWSRSQRSGTPLTLVIGDIDHFKQYNDTYGHQQGDECIKRVAALWNDTFKRPADLPARIGGEEFAIILPGTTVEQCLPKLRMLAWRLEDAALPHAASSVHSRVTMSIGVADIRATQDTQEGTLFELADSRLYAAKTTGRNRIVWE